MNKWVVYGWLGALTLWNLVLTATSVFLGYCVYVNAISIQGIFGILREIIQAM